MNRWTRAFLVLLRLVIGWHILVEGWDKYQSTERWAGGNYAGRPWSSAGYLNEASGPLAGVFRWQAGDLDAVALAKFDVAPLEPGQDAAKTNFRSRIPAALDKAWDEYFQRFVAHYGLTDTQKEIAQAKLDQAKENAVRWLLGLEGERTAEKSFAGTAYKVKETPKDRIDQYRAKLRELRDDQERVMPAFGADIYHEKLRSLKAEVAKQRQDLLNDLNQVMEEPLREVLTPTQVQKGPVPPPEAPRVLRYTDAVVTYGLLAVGVCLVAGAFTRLACLGGAGFMLMFYLAMPALPWAPENLKTEGHYLFVNKNIIEMVALLALATTASGRWLGLDGLLQFVWPWNYRKSQPSL